MFGYIIINKQEMKFKEFDLYQSYYCGFCQALKQDFGKRGQMTLSYDLTFLILLLTSLYEPKTAEEYVKCIAHPFEKHLARTNEFSRYAADMNLLLSYYKCQDDWLDEKKVSKRTMAGLLKKKTAEIAKEYPAKAELIADRLDKIHRCEKLGVGSFGKADGGSGKDGGCGKADGGSGKDDGCGKTDGGIGEDGYSAYTDRVDEIAGYFGDIMAEIFVWRRDEWEQELRRMGFFLGKFIYLMDAYEDLEKDEKEGNFNPFLPLFHTEQFEKSCEGILTMMMAECSKAFEKLPLIEYTEILRNILYSGVWCRYEMVKEKRKRAAEQTAKKSEQR